MRFFDCFRGRRLGPPGLHGAARLARTLLIPASILTLALSGCADDRPTSRNTPLQPGTQGTGEPDFALLWNAGAETARLSDELAAFVARALRGTSTGGPVSTRGVLLEQSNGSWTFTPGSGSDPLIVQMASGRVLTLEFQSASGIVGATDPFELVPGTREALTIGAQFDVRIVETGALDVHLVQTWLPLGDPRLADAAAAAGGFLAGRDGFERVLSGDWDRPGQDFTINATHYGLMLYGPHLNEFGEEITVAIESADGRVESHAFLALRSYEFFHQPGGSAGVGWLLEQDATQTTGGVTWSISSAEHFGGLGHDVWYAPMLVGDPAGWKAVGDLHRNGEKLGRVSFPVLVQAGTIGEPVAVLQGGVFEVVQPAGRPAPVSLFDDPFIQD